MSLSKKLIQVAFLGCFISPATSVAATADTLEKRIQALEAAVEINSEESRDVAKSMSKGLAVSGYADIEYVATNEAAKTNGFRIHHLSLMFKKQVNHKLKFFSEIEFEDGPYAAGATSSGKMLAEAVNFDYLLNASTTLRVGRFFTPAGIWSVDHYPPFVPTQERPKHIRLIFPQLTDGATLSGNHGVGDSFVGYDLYVGNGETTAFDGSADTTNSSKAVGLKVNAALPLADKFEVGVTGYKDRMKVTAAAAAEDKTAYGVHLLAKQGAFRVQAEYARGDYTPVLSSSTGYHRVGYYIQPSYDIDQWTLGYRHDFYDPKSGVANDSQKTNSLFANYHMDANTVVKLEHHLVNLENPASKDYYKSIASIVVNFD